MDNKTKILIIFPPVLIIILIVIAYFIPFKEELSEAERQTLEFTPSDIKVKEREIVRVKKELKNPIDFALAGNGQDLQFSTEKDDLVSQIDYNDKVLSLIVISGKNRMAIIKGMVVKEGDSIEGMKIAKIEHDRVLLRNKTLKWLYIEKISGRQMSEGHIK